MSDPNIKPKHEPIKTYYAELEKYAQLGEENEGTVRVALSEKATELVVERIKADQGLLQEIIARTDIPKRTDLGDIPRYNAPENKTQLYREQKGYCSGCKVYFEMRNLEVDHIIGENVGGTDRIENLQLL